MGSWLGQPSHRERAQFVGVPVVHTRAARVVLLRGRVLPVHSVCGRVWVSAALLLRRAHRD